MHQFGILDLDFFLVTLGMFQIFYIIVFFSE